MKKIVVIILGLLALSAPDLVARGGHGGHGHGHGRHRRRSHHRGHHWHHRHGGGWGYGGWGYGWGWGPAWWVGWPVIWNSGVYAELHIREDAERRDFEAMERKFRDLVNEKQGQIDDLRNRLENVELSDEERSQYRDQIETLTKEQDTYKNDIQRVRDQVRDQQARPAEEAVQGEN